MKELLKHLPAIKGFIEERTMAFQEISDNVLKSFLKEAYKLPFLFPVRIIVSEDKFVNFLFDMRKDLFEGKKLEMTENEEAKEVVKEETVAEVKEKKPVAKKETAVKESVKSVKTTKIAKTTPTKTKETVVATTTKKPTTAAKTTKTVVKKDKVVS